MGDLRADLGAEIGPTRTQGDDGARYIGLHCQLPAVRADAVRTQLLARGVEPDRLTALGMGHADPIADNLTKSGKAANRRIEFLLLRPGETGLAPPKDPSTDSDNGSSSIDK